MHWVEPALCDTHLRETYQLKVRESVIPNAGMGVFTLIKRAKRRH